MSSLGGTAYPIWSDILESSFQSKKSKLVGLFSHISVKKRPTSFERTCANVTANGIGCTLTAVVESFIGQFATQFRYGVATISRLVKIVDLFCRISSLL